ncbi:Iron-dependent repressor IdeR [Symmachiella dynata]|uniref:Transcriptional regulator MntR n=2 Tax=Symmachiella dynata TaxID=2527995 RepID=A0A517ZIA7_9PLAN|nr:metal-dependent transcriptional regulator [Symmachiella dynata]QDU42214.1 Iron-dependent repressor IdeR [Symmachiella dynata]
MPSLTVENYLKTVLQICIEADSEWASTGQIATALNVSPGTVTSMLKTLSDSSLANYKPYSGVKLTKQGRMLAVRMLRRHRLLELFLVRTLELTWDQVHDEAERMEHAVSDELIDRIDEYLERPQVDPHGDPIPSADGTLTGEDYGLPLSDTDMGDTVRIIRVRNQQPEFLRYLADNGMALGAVGTVQENSDAGDIVAVQMQEKLVTLGQAAAEMLYVERVSDE